ncbi:MAG: glutamate synthase-related protein [archaeon]
MEERTGCEPRLPAPQGVSEHYARYHIKTEEAPPVTSLPPKFNVRHLNNCLDAGECAEVCVYSVHEMVETKISEPIEDRCRGCFLCYLRCPENAISLQTNPEFKKLGNRYFTPERIETLYFEAGTGRVPVSGTGYKGAFAGKGFDGIWFDFSEIVRPTRDGIHGREYISTSVDLGRRLPHLEFSKDGRLLSDTSTNIEIPIPMILDSPSPCDSMQNLQLILAKAATALETFAIVDVREYSPDLLPYSPNLIPRICAGDANEFEDLIKISKIVEGDFKNTDEAKNIIEKIRTCNPSSLISFHVPYDEQSCENVEALAKMGCDIAHCYVRDEIVEKDPDVIKNAIQSVHSYLVDKGIRDSITLISGGGIAEAAHVPKSIILGADAVSVRLAYQIALGCKICYGSKQTTNCTMRAETEETKQAAQRIINLMGSWRDQLLEVLGGMGLREVRRQRGEIGRTMLYEDLEKRIFGGGE